LSIYFSLKVSNAGVASQGDEVLKNENGFELTVQVNHIANMLLVLLLTPSLKRSSSPRINVVSSGAFYYVAKPTIDDPTPVTTLLEQPQPGSQQYSSSKLLNVLFVTEYVARCPYKVWICSCNPGYTDSQLGTKNEKGEEAHARPTSPIPMPMRTTYEGAKTVIHASIAPELLKEKNGPYITNLRISKPSKASQDLTFSKNTWNDTINILKKYVDHDSIEEWAWKQ